MERDGKIAYLPTPAPIDAYGDGGFRFAGMSHVGSLLCLPSGITAWDAKTVEDIKPASLDRLFKEADTIDVLLIGTGISQIFLAPSLVSDFRKAGLVVECMATGAAARTYNVLLAEKRSIAAALLAVGERPLQQ